jgi:hypothetical protein
LMTQTCLWRSLECRLLAGHRLSTPTHPTTVAS